MCSTFSLAAKPCGGANNGKILYPTLMVTKTRAEVIVAPKQPTRPAFPQLLKQDSPYPDLRVREIVERQSNANSLAKHEACRKPEFHNLFLEEAFENCKNICREYAKTFYLGWFMLMNLCICCQVVMFVSRN